MIIKKYLREAKIGDVQFETTDTDCISIRIIDKTDFPQNVRADGLHILPNHARKGGCSYGCWSRDWENEFIPEPDAKIVRDLVEDFNIEARSLYNKYMKTQGEPLYYVSDTKLNIDLKNGDIIIGKSPRYGHIDFLQIDPGDYNYDIDKILAQDEQFCEWLCESGKDYDFYIHGRNIRFETRGCMYTSRNGLASFSFKSEPYQTYLVDVDLYKISKEIDTLCSEYYVKFREIFEKYYTFKKILDHKDFEGNLLCY